MKSTLLPAFILFSIHLFSQVSSDYAVMLQATWTESPPTITLQWPSYAGVTSYSVYKKEKSDTGWGASIATLDGAATAYTDTDVLIDSAYEYRVVREVPGIVAQGYLSSGIQLHLPDYRGKCLLVIDTTYTAGMENELHRFMKDISGDGWSVERMNVAADDDVEEIRELINTNYAADEELQCVILFGHVPVPYSGNLNPDGHPDHQGAWAADGIYADVDGAYTDETVNNTVATREENKNIPGDGKFDQSVFKSKLELQIGRIDLSDLPFFPQSEEQLLKNYLDKDHAFRNGEIEFMERGLVDDNFGAFGGEAFASSAWRNFSPMFGSSEIYETDYFTTLYSDTYLWSYGCGGGWYQGASGVGSTYEFTLDTVHSIFTMLFGSYFGDWDVTDNFLRAPLASPYTLTNAWSGRPYWHFHHMAMGENIGYSARVTQNNQSTYDDNVFGHWVHIALMGDPTLRMHTVKPPSDISLLPVLDCCVEIQWTASADPDVIGYYVYRSDKEFGKYERITGEIVESLSYEDVSGLNGLNYYMVKAVKLEETPSGSYYNLSTGITDTVTYIPSAIENNFPQDQFTIWPNPAHNEFHLNVNQAASNEFAEIYTIDGKLVSVISIVQTETTISATAFSPGMYLVRYGNLYKKLIIN